MPQPQINELNESLDHLIASTNEGKIDWVKLNPTTVIWNFQTPRPGRMIIQQIYVIISGMQVKKFIFQVFDAANAQKLSINSADYQQLEDKIKTLYDIASKVISQGGIDFLKSVLPPQ